MTQPDGVLLKETRYSFECFEQEKSKVHRSFYHLLEKVIRRMEIHDFLTALNKQHGTFWTDSQCLATSWLDIRANLKKTPLKTLQT